MNETYNVCRSCALVLTNGDDTHVHPHMLPNVLESVENMGPVALSGVGEDDLMFICDCCNGRNFGQIHRYETNF